MTPAQQVAELGTILGVHPDTETFVVHDDDPSPRDHGDDQQRKGSSPS